MRKNQKTTLATFLMLVFLCSMSLNIFYMTFNDDDGNKSQSSINDKLIERDDFNRDLKLSDSTINIITPENKTYTGPMSGYYFATYSFNNDAINSLPSGWASSNGGSCTTKVAASLGDHVKVLDCYKTGFEAMFMVSNYFTAQTSGTMEFWLRSTDVRYGSDMYIRQTGYAPSQTNLGIGITGGKVYCCGTQSGYWASNNCWYHFKISFDVATDHCSAWVYNSTNANVLTATDVDFWTACDDIASIGFGSTWSASVTYHTYIDAVGYSWDPNYDIGDNEEEGLLLSYTNSTTLSWTGYSLDGQANKTINGNKTIPIPAEGSHSIQVFGNDSLANEYASEKRYFSINYTSINHISIITPENKTYASPMSGYYPATYGFESDAIGSVAKEWSSFPYPSCTQKIISAAGNHTKVYELYDNYNNGYAGISNNVSSQTYGTIELWWRHSDVSLGAYFYLDDSDDITDCRFIKRGSTEDKWAYDNGAEWVDFLTCNVYDNTWYHLRIDFEYTTGSYMGLTRNQARLTINGATSGTFPLNASYLTMDSLNCVSFASSWGSMNHYVYVDTVGYSWDPNYDIGDNENEGLLLSYTNTTNLSWAGYSLDGQANITINGNKTIPMPINGLHTIKLHGNSTSGVMTSSELKYFTVDYWDTIAPTIAGPNGEITLEQFESYTIQWNITEIYGGSYEITQNLVEIDSGPFNNWDNVSWIANTMMLGDINYTIVATDPFDNIGTRSILIHVVDATNPAILGLTSDFSVFQGQSASFSWRILEHNPTNYEIYDNGSIIKSLTAYQNYTIITYSFLNWTIGQHKFEIRAYDSQGHSNSTQIIVTVLSRPSQYRFLIPNAITCIDWISTYGLYIEFSANASGFLEMQRLTSIFQGIDELKINNLEILYFYNFTIYDADLTENESIIENALIRFYYNPSQVKNPSNLRLYHYIFDIANIIWVWKMSDFTINETGHYIELNSTDFSIFALVEYKLPCCNDDDTTDTKYNKDLIAIIFGDYLVLVVLGAAIGLAVPSAYVIKSRKKKKEAATTDLKEKANIKREVLQKADKLSKTTDSITIKKDQSAKLVVPALPKEIFKAKKTKQAEPIKAIVMEDKKRTKEIEQTEKELEIKEKLDVCAVHKGTIEGISYVCPKCHTKYCLKCAKTLMENNENCWVCETKFALNKEFLGASQKVIDQKADAKGKGSAKEHLDNTKALLTVSGNNGNDDLNILKKINITAITKEEWEKIDKIDMDEDERENFVKELLTLTPEERVEVIDDIIRKLELKGD